MTKQGLTNIIQQWLAGDERAFNRIQDFYYPKLLSAALKIAPSREDAEELVMNTLLKIWQHKNRLSEIRDFDDYLFGILRQEVVRLSRKRVLITENIEDQTLTDLGAEPHPELDLQELMLRYQNALSKLSPKQREVFLAIRDGDLSHKELAERNGMSVNTVSSHMNSALRILREEMNGNLSSGVILMLSILSQY